MVNAYFGITVTYRRFTGGARPIKLHRKSKNGSRKLYRLCKKSNFNMVVATFKLRKFNPEQHLLFAD